MGDSFSSLGNSIQLAISLTRRITNFRSGAHKLVNEDEFLCDLRMKEFNFAVLTQYIKKLFHAVKGALSRYFSITSKN